MVCARAPRGVNNGLRSLLRLTSALAPSTLRSLGDVQSSPLARSSVRHALGSDTHGVHSSRPVHATHGSRALSLTDVTCHISWVTVPHESLVHPWPQI